MDDICYFIVDKGFTLNTKTQKKTSNHIFVCKKCSESQNSKVRDKAQFSGALVRQYRGA